MSNSFVVMAPHVRDTVRTDQQGPSSTRMVENDHPNKSDISTTRTRSSSRRPSNRTQRRRASTSNESTVPVSTLDRDIEVSPREQRSGKSVSFNPIVRFKPIRHVNDISDREFFSIWYLEQDMEEIFDHCVETVRMMVRGDLLTEEDGYCPRGLEYKTPAGARVRKESKANAMKVVLDEQKRQILIGCKDAELLARMYRDAAKDTRRVSRLMATKDEEANRPILQSKSSILLLRQTNALGVRELETRTTLDLLEQDFNSSATSVMDEFNQSLKNCHRQQQSPPKSSIQRVRFGELPRRDDR